MSVCSGAQQYTLHQQKFPPLRSTVGCLIQFSLRTRAPLYELMSDSWDRCVPEFLSAVLCLHDGMSASLYITCFLLGVICLLFGCDPDSASSRSLSLSADEELGTMAENNPLTGYEPNFIDNYHISKTTDIFIQESSSDSRPSNLHDLEIDDYTIGRALSSPLFQERGDPASRRQVCHSLDESLLSSQSSSVGHVRTGRLVSDEFGSLISNVRENPRRDSENEQIRSLLERQKRATSR